MYIFIYSPNFSVTTRMWHEIILNGVELVWIESFTSSILVTLLRLNNPDCSTIYLQLKRGIHALPRDISDKCITNYFVPDLNSGRWFHFRDAGFACYQSCNHLNYGRGFFFFFLGIVYFRALVKSKMSLKKFHITISIFFSQILELHITYCFFPIMALSAFLFNSYWEHPLNCHPLNGFTKHCRSFHRFSFSLPSQHLTRRCYVW